MRRENVPVTTLIILIVLTAVLFEAITRRRPHSAGWLAFGCWLVAGFLSALATISFAIGPLVLPFALLAIFGASRLSVWPSIFGFIGGAGLIGVLVSALNFGEESSPDYYDWLIVGSGIAAASVATFVAARRRYALRVV
jgi:hypothetical protein